MIPFLIIVIYAALCLFMAKGFMSYPVSKTTISSTDIRFSIVIAARDEQKTIANCIRTITEQNFPKQNIEVILVNDNSEDETAETAKKLLIQYDIDHTIITNTQHLGKKKSLIKAIDVAKHNYIIARDADTFTATNDWLSSISSYIQETKKEFIICPIAIKHQGGLLSAMQEVETSVLNIFTIATTYFKIPFLCSGANLVFSKRLFEQTNKYADHLHIQSGDDVYFLEAVKKLEPHQITYLKNTDALVYTYPEPSIEKLFSQKIRWSGKVFKLTNLFNWLSAAIIAFCNLTFVYLVFMLVMSVFNAKITLFFVFLKLIIDILLVFLASHFVKVKCNAVSIGLVAFLYPFYATSVAFLAPVIKPKWKTS